MSSSPLFSPAPFLVVPQIRGHKSRPFPLSPLTVPRNRLLREKSTLTSWLRSYNEKYWAVYKKIAQKNTITGVHSNQDPRCTQKPIHSPMFTHHIRSWLLFHSICYLRPSILSLLIVVTQIRGHIAGSSPIPTTVRALHFLSREDFSSFFPRRLASMYTRKYPHLGTPLLNWGTPKWSHSTALNYLVLHGVERIFFK